MSTMQEEFEAMLVLYRPRAEKMTFENSEGVTEYWNPVENLAWKMWQAATEAAKATSTAPPLPQWIDDQKGKDPLIDDLVHYIETLQAWAARQPAPALSVKTWQERLKESASEGWTTLSETHMQAEIAELRAALAATAAPVLQPHYRMSEKPTAWLHTLPEGKFFNGAFSDNSQIIRDKDEADSECYFHGGTLTPLFTAEWTQAGLDYVNEKADELHKKIVGSQP